MITWEKAIEEAYYWADPNEGRRNATYDGEVLVAEASVARVWVLIAAEIRAHDTAAHVPGYVPPDDVTPPEVPTPERDPQ